MSKNIFDEALEILLDSYKDPQDEENNCYMINYGEINRLARALEQAQKQEKLLKLYQRLNHDWDDLTITKVEDIQKHIKVLEND